MDEIGSIFARYEAVRPRLPEARFGDRAREIGSLLDISTEADAFVFDAFGVLNVGETPIPGAAERLDALRAAGKHIRILSNAASYNHDKATEKFRRLGMSVASDEIITSRDAALRAVSPGLWGCIAAPADDLADIPAETLRLGLDRAEYDRVDGILFLSTEVWSAEQQALLEASLHDRPRPVIIANADVVAPREGGFTLEPGEFGHRLMDLGAEDVRFFGKPFGDVYGMIEDTLPGIAPDRIVMCGDSLHTDILGAAACGWRSVLVTQDGLLSGVDPLHYCAAATIQPDWHLGRI
ncbi:HAD-IIA family hydrolase [Palleronia caenipelagi]|uniref:HAD-IIA family hydrolase n=1 Tax=Palleronia caenipelagi TaxID=2489174 RepID=A0A547Q908_9RHOB|nr:HAD-IIA family hydrolase [Palleronia caenipelagi]TRD22844.1 HAD-IIA family hydrolase [Palleronia caenipelagi]